MNALHRTALATAVVVAAGCSSLGDASSAFAPSGSEALPKAPSSGAYSPKQSLVFVSEYPQNVVFVFQTADLASNPSPIATIATQQTCPYGLAADKKGMIYVAAGCASSGGDVEEYPKGSTTLKKAITDGISHPLGLAIDKKQTLYVSDGSPAAIQEYPYGATSPSKTISGSPLGEPFGLALDGAGNLYVADFVADAVFELPAGGSALTNLNLQDLVEPLGVAFDQKHHLLWVTDGKGQRVNVYKIGSTTPIESITGFTFPYAISLQNKGKPKATVVISDLEDRESGYAGSVFAYAPGQYTPYATLTTDIVGADGLLITQP